MSDTLGSLSSELSDPVMRLGMLEVYELLSELYAIVVGCALNATLRLYRLFRRE